MICELLDTCGFIDILRESDPFTEHTVKITYCDNEQDALCALPPVEGADPRGHSRLPLADHEVETKDLMNRDRTNRP